MHFVVFSFNSSRLYICAAYYFIVEKYRFPPIKRRISVERHLLKETLVHIPNSGNNAGACCLNALTFCPAQSFGLSSHAIYLAFAELEFSNMKSLSRTE
jgi:hypothetical protein